jgi:uncharacterized protein (TIGR00255 family)
MSTSPAVRSMTGFARVARGNQDVEIEIEVRSVNHRFLEVAFRAPRCYSIVERDVKALFQRLHKRGRIDVSVVRRVVGATSPQSPERSESFDRLVKSYTAACKMYGIGTEGLSGFLGQLVLREQGAGDEASTPGEAEVAQLLGAIDTASEALAAMREQEGNALVADISGRLARIASIRAEISRGAEAAPARLKEALESRIQALAPELRGDPQRLALEVALLADKVDVSEELSRLETHLEHFSSTLKGHSDGVGRKLDFIVQEIGRELNTIGSKAQDAAVQSRVVDAKAELERIREQVQNVE